MKVLRVHGTPPYWYEHIIRDTLPEEEKGRATEIVKSRRQEWFDKFSPFVLSLRGVQQPKEGKIARGWSDEFTIDVVDTCVTEVIHAIGNLFGMDLQNGQSGKITNIEVIIDVETPFDAMDKLIAKMELAATRLSEMAERSEVADTGVYAPGWNRHVGAPVPGLQLIHINEFCLLQDCCTDNLQAHMSEGWRVVAVCPQESRRPDYVVGRYNANFDGNKIPSKARRDGLER